jgi:ABC-type nitrate/sulfonate/bicarbonate transport system ATPase subunit
VTVRMEEGRVVPCVRGGPPSVVPRSLDEVEHGMTTLETGTADGPARPLTGAASVPALRIERVRVAFGPRADRLVALDGVDLTVAHREVVALIGPNGCGKSTLLRVAGGLLMPEMGVVELGGRRVLGPDAAAGFVFQEPRLLPWRDTLDNVALPLELAGVGRARRRAHAAELLTRVGLERVGSLRPHELSGGMRQRAAIARALALEPEVLLLDEPFSALDALTRERFNVELLKLWARTSTTIVLVTHSIREALFLADRVLVMSPRPGRVIAEVVSPLSRPRQARDLEDPAIAGAAIEIRHHLGWSGEEGDRPSELTTDEAVVATGHPHEEPAP